MRFSKRLEQEIVPEWRAKYVDYKAGKSLVDTIEQAALKVDNASQEGTTNDNLFQRSKTFFEATASSGARRYSQHVVGNGDDSQALRSAPWPMGVEPDASGDTHRQPRDSPGEPYQTGDDHRPVNRQTTKLRGNEILSEMLHLRQQWFYNFMDKELDKVEDFYKAKEEEAAKKLEQLRRQLRIMRDRRYQELGLTKNTAGDNQSESGETVSLNDTSHLSVSTLSVNRLSKFRRPSSPFSALTTTANDRSSSALPTPANDNRNNDDNNNNDNNEPWRDYTRRPLTPSQNDEDGESRINQSNGSGAKEEQQQQQQQPRFRSARRKLKTAFQEFYKSVELLKTYAELNRTAFRALNRKADKAAAASSPSSCAWFDAKVGKGGGNNGNGAYFVYSDRLERITDEIEDLYARYFEDSNHKIAVAKLRRLANTGPGDRSYSAFANGAMIGLGLTFWVEAAIWAVDEINHDNEEVAERAEFLLQVYAGYTLMLYLFWWFCFNCRTWSRAKINYPHIFEFDQRNNLDWRQLAAFPSFFTLLLGVVAWLNFLKVGGDRFFTYWPVVLLIITAVVICNPLPILRWKSRKWFMWTHVRLLLGGLLPVEFRDFFLGDQYVSLSYAVGNMELFFCLYTTLWSEPTECSSLNSSTYGFIAAIPAILRATQCVRRFLDSGHWFPHLANMVKYMITIASLIALSFFRTDESSLTLTVFVIFMVLNAIVAGTWDILFDFSLLQKGSRNPYLRDILPLGNPGIYYGIMILDPILRFNWILLAFLTHSDYSALAAFLVGAIEVTRRGLWTLLRVENEHSANVGKEKAHRDVPLPYQDDDDEDEGHLLMKTRIVEEDEEGGEEDGGQGRGRRRGSGVVAFELQSTSATTTTPGQQQQQQQQYGPANADLEAGGVSPSNLQRTGTMGKISRAISLAHCEDFERRRRPAGESAYHRGGGGGGGGGGMRPSPRVESSSSSGSGSGSSSDEDPYFSGSEASSDEAGEGEGFSPVRRGYTLR